MSTWVWVLIAVVVLVVAAAAVWQWTVRRRTEQLREQFGPEYDRAVRDADSRREGESELAARQERHEELELRPLPSAARDRYLDDWRAVQAQFVDDPRAAVGSADGLIQSVMRDRGYPVDDFDQRASDLSVDHADVVEHYREGHRLATEGARDGDSTENLRLAMRHFRALFEELVDANGSASTDDPRRAGAGKEIGAT